MKRYIHQKQSTLIATVVSFVAGKLGLWAEKKIEYSLKTMNKLSLIIYVKGTLDEVVHNDLYRVSES